MIHDFLSVVCFKMSMTDKYKWFNSCKGKISQR